MYALFQARTVISDFAVILAIALMVATDAIIGLNTPKLEVPAKFHVSFHFIYLSTICLYVDKISLSSDVVNIVAFLVDILSGSF